MQHAVLIPLVTNPWWGCTEKQCRFTYTLFPKQDFQIFLQHSFSCLNNTKFALILKVPTHCEEIVNHGGLQLLMKLRSSKAAVSLKIQCYIARILANMALNEHLHAKIVQAGKVHRAWGFSISYKYHSGVCDACECLVAENGWSGWCWAIFPPHSSTRTLVWITPGALLWIGFSVRT